MSGLYTIPVNGLKEGRHTFKIEINKEFFDLFEESEINEGELIAVIEADRRSSHIDLQISISGKVKVSCDRCLDFFDQPVECQNKLMVKFGNSFNDNDPDMIIIPSVESELDLKHYFYEFIHLALPIQRLHPDDILGNSTCNPLMLEKLREYIVEDKEDKNKPEWDELKKVLNNK